MIEINLLPSGEKRRAVLPGRSASARLPRLPRSPGDPWTAGFALLALVVVLGVGFSFWQGGAREEQLQAELRKETADSTRFAATIDLLSALRARQDTIQQKIEVIRSVDARRYEWPHLLDEISRATPQFTWLTKLTTADAPAVAPAPSDSAAPPAATQPPSFTLEGNAGSVQALTRFMTGLEESPFIRDVTLVTSEQVTEQGRSFQKFTLEARYEMPDSAFIQTTPVVFIR